jgi:hypothetical protein
MRLFGSGPSNRLAIGLGVLYFVAHLSSLAPSLEDIDSINFALGLRDFDPSRHQPHPPGSPVYIAAGRVMYALVSGVSALGRIEAEAMALALLSALAGALAIACVVRVLIQCTPPHRATSLWAAALMAACPLFWLSGLRPMSDLAGLGLALLAQAWLLESRADRRLLMPGAFITGLAAGIRVQTALLTLPLVVLAAVWHRQAGAAWIATRPLAAMAAGVLVWAIPLVADSGGVAAYLQSLGSQASEDFAWVSMLWLEPTPRRLAFALYETFVLPWGSPLLAGAVAAAAAAGALAMFFRERRALGLIGLAFGPYLAFHLLFQETITVRYALPTLPLVAWLAARGIAAMWRVVPGPVVTVIAAAFVAAALFVALPIGLAYGREAHPAFRAIQDMEDRAAVDPPAAVYSHYSLWRSLQAESGMLPLAEPRRQYEWMGPVSYWRDGGTEPIWFLADPYRTDLALVDPQARADVTRYGWAVADRGELSGSRPLGADWYRLAPPGWFAGEGWSLTPETGGLATLTAAGPDHRPIEAWVQRRPGALHLVVGGRHLGEPGDPAADFELTLDGVVRDRWSVGVTDRNFVRFLDIPDGIGAGAGRYAPLTIAARAAGGSSARAVVGVRQFDIQPAGRMLFAFAEGWHEEEYEGRIGRRWRWTSERSVLRIKGGTTGVRIRMRGESPLLYQGAPPAVRFRAGDRVVAEFVPQADFEWTVNVSAADLAASGGAIAIETDPVYLPGAVERTSDARRLGLRVFETTVTPLAAD